MAVQRQRLFERSPGDAVGLLEAVADAAAFLHIEAPLELTRADFDRARAPAGHPQAPTARTISRRLGMTWLQLVALALGPRSDWEHRLGVALSAADLRLSEDEIRSALQTVARRLAVSILSAALYEQERARLLAADRRRYRNGRRLWLPTANQIVIAAGSWRKALALAGLETRSATADRGVGWEQALDLCIELHGALPMTTELELFARANELALARRERPYAEIVAAVRARRSARGAATPTKPPPTRERPDYRRRFTAEEAPQLATLPRRAHRSWNRERCLDKLLEFLQTPLERHNQDAYQQWAPANAAPSVHTLGRHGGFGPLLAEARLRRK